MNKVAFIGLLMIPCILLVGQPYGQPSELPDGFTAKYIFGGNISNPPIDPISMTFLNDSTILLTAKDGKVYIVENEVLNDTPLLELDVDQRGERGLQGIAIDPEFEFNHFIYLYYTVSVGNFNRVSRFYYYDGHIHKEDEEVLLEINEMSDQVFFHNGGHMEFGLDGKLYIATGDGSKPSEAQSQSSLLGKILRINKDGTIPTDNPFYFQNDGVYKSIYALGFRNPFKFNFSSDGRLICNDVGTATWEEINEVSSGKNYGWPLVEGRLEDNPSNEPLTNYQDPFFVYPHTEGCAITGGANYDKAIMSFPKEYYGKYFYSDFCTRYLYTLDLTTNERTPFMLSHFSPTHVSISNQGELYYFGFPGGGSGELWKISYATDGPPSIVLHPQSTLQSIGDSAVFQVASSGAKPLTYQWFKNGEAIPGANKATLVIGEVVFSDDSSEYYCQVENEVSTVQSNIAILRVTNRTRPTVYAQFIPEIEFYTAGDTIVVKGTAIDEVQGKLSGSTMQWRVDFHHDFHYHPFISSLTGVDSIGFVVPKLGETSSNVWFRVHLTAENNIGLSQTNSVNIFPLVSKISVISNQNEIDVVYLDGSPFILPVTISGVAGTTRSLSVKDSVIYSNENILLLNGWNNISSPNLVFDVPAKDSTFTVTYDKYFLGEGSGLRSRFYNSLIVDENQPDTTFLSGLLDFNWGSSAPVSGINANDFQAIWDGFLKVPVQGNYRFHIQVSGGVSLMIGDSVIFNDLVDSGLRGMTREIVLNAGVSYPIKLKYNASTSSASITLKWSHTRFPETLIPLHCQYDQYQIPQLLIYMPQDKFYLGQNISIKATATDFKGGAINADSMKWFVHYVNEDFTSLLYAFESTDTISFHVPDTLHYWQGLHLKVLVSSTDRNGFDVDSLFNIEPILSVVKVNSNLIGVTVQLNGVNITLPYEADYIKGFPINSVVIDSVIIRENTLHYYSELKNGSKIEFEAIDTIIRVAFKAYELQKGIGFKADYFSATKTFDDKPDSTWIEKQVNFIHNQLSGKIKVRWFAWITPPETGEYLLTVQSSGAATISINERTFEINSSGLIMKKDSVYMRKGGYYPVEVLYQSDGVSGFIQLYWQSDNLPGHFLPGQQAFLELPEISVFPNPVETIATLDVPDNSSVIEISIMTITGDLIRSITTGTVDGKAFVDFSALPSGLYLLLAKWGKNQSTVKIIKK